ncbi:SAM-dependent methyltransferase [Asanoa sp. NPDC050611]|uniref:SAM-dependent methyltransferase n=1 Tax=Asanoa sp. NPDC050611 TaxID=3157098 RepID=UPI0033F54F0A
MASVANDGNNKPATAARIYDFHLGGTHNFAADRAAAQAITKMFPFVPLLARTNRAFLGRAVRHLAGQGITQFLDVGSGIPTEGNVHEIAQEIVPEARVVYVDMDPVAVSESLDLLEGNDNATAIRADLRDPQSILDHPQVRKIIDFDQPVGLLMVAVLHFVSEDEAAAGAVRELLRPLVPGSYLAISHGSAEGMQRDLTDLDNAQDVYKRDTATPFVLRSKAQVGGWFEGLELVEPGVVWLPEWRPAPGDPQDFVDRPTESGGVCAVGKVR